jgi:hypothetical protein
MWASLIMGFRRSPHRVAAARAWRRFVERNARVIAAAGLPISIVASVATWDDFLMHGRLADDPEGFAIDRLSPDQYESLAELASNYFAAGYEFYTPAALRAEDQDALRARFDAGR